MPLSPLPPMSKHNFLAYFPGAPNIQPESLTLEDSSYVRAALKQCAAEFGLQVQEDMRLIAPPDLASTPSQGLYERTRQWLKSQGNSLSENVLEQSKLLKKTRIFQNYNQDAEIIHLLLITDEIMDSLDEPGELVSLTKKWDNSRFAAINNWAGLLSPSQVVASPDAIKAASRFLTYGRPVESQGLQPALYNSAIAQLTHDLAHLDAVYLEPSTKHLKNCLEFMRISNKFYTGPTAEKQRLQELREYSGIFFEDPEDNIKEEYSASAGKGAIVDTGFIENGFIYTLFEGKNESGLGGNPFLQSMVSYAKVNEGKKDALRKTNLPAILIGVAGNVLTIGVAIFTDAIYVDTLLTMDLLLGTFPDQNILRFSRVASAVAVAKVALRRYYAALSNPLDVNPHPALPDPTPVEGVIPKLRYTGKFDKETGLVKDVLEEKLRSSAVFTAELADSGQKVVVKFTPTYCVEAHTLLADHDLAPTLHVCTKLKGGLWMVVMDRVEGERLTEMMKSGRIPMRAYDQAKEAVDLLHAENLVFGDLRVGNMIYDSQNVGRLRLVDFDLAGTHGMTRYPPTLNRADKWPLSMMRGGLLLKQQDLEWLVILKKLIDT